MPKQSTTEKKPKKATKALVEQVKSNRIGGEMDPSTKDVFAKAAALIQFEKRAYEDANRSIKTNIKRAYKNYLGVLDQPYDDYTKRRKICTTLTHDIVDSTSKPVQITAKSIKILPLTAESRGKAKILNMVLPYFFQMMDFDPIMDLFKHRTAWLGTQSVIVDWIYEEKEEATNIDPTEEIEIGLPDENAKKTKTRKVITDRPRIQLTDVMDFFMPATAESMEWAIENASVIYRDVVTVDDIIGNPNYDLDVRSSLKGRTMSVTNTDDSTSLMKYSMSGYSGPGTGRMMQSGETERYSRPIVARYRRFGKVPKSWITGDSGDELTPVDAIIEAVAEDAGEYNFKTLCIRLSSFGSRGPFCDCRYNVLPKRYFGEGIGERLIPLQVWHNEIVNTRRNNEILVQQRMYIIKKGKVDPRQLYSRAGGAIEAENPTQDVIPLPTPDIPSSSFAEDNYILSSGQRLAGVAMTPIQKDATATEINNIQANANITSTEFLRSLEQFLEKLVLHHLLPLLKKYFTDDKAIPITLSARELEQLDTFNGYRPFTVEEATNLRFLIVDDPSLFDGDFALTVDIEGSGTNRAQQVAALTNLMTMASKIQGARINFTAVFRKIAELSGVVDERLFEDAESAAPTGVTGSPMMAQGMGGASNMTATQMNASQMPQPSPANPTF